MYASRVASYHTSITIDSTSEIAVSVGGNSVGGTIVGTVVAVGGTVAAVGVGPAVLFSFRAQPSEAVSNGPGSPRCATRVSVLPSR